ncbi:MAG TPA: hypothetical protein DGL25_05630 [Dehalococcoidia bacterium]|nr:hypothetical protein [Dehalococcoidia bacterium]|tara:strand:- start:1970 stop:2458 length:489 start_codon:yes stop_codon:yes gene_type:complete
MDLGMVKQRLVLAGLVLAIGTVVAVVGFHAHSHAHGDLRAIDAEGNVQVLGAWRLGTSAGGELPVVSSGNLRFELSNSDGVLHNFVIVRTELEGTELPMTRGQVDLAASGELVGRVQTVRPGITRGQTFHMPPGRYILFCNIAGHYEGGMYYTLRVEENPTR